MAALKMLMAGKKRKGDDDEEGDSSSESDSGFGGVHSFSGEHRTVMQVHLKTPGRLAELGLRAMADWVAERGGERGKDKQGVKISNGMIRQMRTLASAVDALCR